MIFSLLCSLVVIEIYIDRAAPVLSNIENVALYYTENTAATEIMGTLTIGDLDTRTLHGASIQIINNFQYAEDTLAYNASMPTSITVNTQVSGAIILSGVASLSEYQTALRAITYHNSKNPPNISTRTVSFSVSDGTNNSLPVTRDIIIIPSNDAPVLDNTHVLKLDAVREDAGVPSQ